MSTEISEIYKPIIRDGIKIDGLAAEATPKDAKATIIQKSFIISYDENFERYCNNILNLVLGNSQNETLNKVLVVIKKDDRAIIYQNFPLKFQIRAKKSVKAFELVRHDDVLDITGVEFSDAIFNLDIQNGDKFVWLFRTNWKFGLYFDFSGKLDVSMLPGELANCYRRLLYLELYSFLENEVRLKELLDEGWFPFIQLIGSRFQSLMNYFADEKKYAFQVEKILEYFSHEEFSKLSSNWWSNPIFNEKRDILEAGIEAYFQGTKSGYINAIKTIATEIEGVIRVSYFRRFGEKPSMQQIQQYITDLGKQKFSSVGSLGFPSLFYDYLNQSVFKGFDLESGEIPSSRHSFAHGVAKFENYSQIRAFQLLLTLDQIYFYLQ
ncbi:MAG: hypothetical protein HY869_01140 [Chloroflexi bacterium]|nr:hypothetical protein [Chloroflexota bacterium]